MVEGEEVYEIDQIKGKGKDESGQVVYLVKWQGYPDEESTWEPLCNLEGNEHLIQEFESRNMPTAKVSSPS